jgi:hypothetical protein
MAVDLSTFYITIEATTPIFKSRVDGKDSVIISTTIPKEDVIKTQAHRDPAYQASFNRCTSLGCSDYTQGFNYIPSCGECEKPLFPPFSERPLITCLADTLLKRINYTLDGLLDNNRSATYGGAMPIVDNRVETNRTDYYYSDAYIEYKLYNGTSWSPTSTSGWKNFPGSGGDVSFNKFYSMTGYWFGYEPCHGANNLYQCAVSCDSGEVVGCWQVGDLQRELGDNPLNTYGEVKFGSVWGFVGLESSYPQTIRYYQIYDPAQIVAAGVILTKELIVPLNPTISENGYMTSAGTGQLSENTGYGVCKPKRTSLDFGDADYLRETNCLSGGTKRNTDERCSTCEINSYKPTRAIDKMLKFADSTAPDYTSVELKDIPKEQFEKLKFSVVGDVVGKILTDGTNCFFPKSTIDTTVGKFLLGGPVDAIVVQGYKQATFTDLGLKNGFYYDDCMSCLEEKANAIYSVISTARTEAARINPFYQKCGVDIAGKTVEQRVASGHLPYNIDCSCVRCGDIYITGAPIWKSTPAGGYSVSPGSASGSWSITEPWFTGAENASLYFANLPKKRKTLAVVDNKQVYIDDPLCVPSSNPLPEENPDYPYASDRSPECWNPNDSQYKRIWWFFDKSKKFTDLGFRSLAPMSAYWNWQTVGSTTTKLWYQHRYNSKHLWSGCGGLKDNDRAVVPFCITCYEKMQSKVDSLNNIVVPSTLSAVTGIKLAAENEFTDAEISYKGLPSVYAVTDPNYAYGLPRSYLYYSRRASTSYYPCDNTNTGPRLGTYKCSCGTLPCMDEIMLTTVPIKYRINVSAGSTDIEGLKTCSTLSPGTEAFPGVYELHLEGTEKISDSPTSDKLYPLVGPNKYKDGVPLRNYNVGLNWDSYKNSRLQPENSGEIGAAGAYKYQYASSFTNNGYFANFYVDNHDPLYFWNRPVSFLNSGVLIKSHAVSEVNETLFRLARLRDIYHINCSKSSNNKWGEYGYVDHLISGTPKPYLNSTHFSSLTNGATTTPSMPHLRGPVIPQQVDQN